MNKAVVFEGYYLHTQKGTKVCAIWPAVSLCQTRQETPYLATIIPSQRAKNGCKTVAFKDFKGSSRLAALNVVDWTKGCEVHLPQCFWC